MDAPSNYGQAQGILKSDQSSKSIMNYSWIIYFIIYYIYYLDLLYFLLITDLLFSYLLSHYIRLRD